MRTLNSFFTMLLSHALSRAFGDQYRALLWYYEVETASLQTRQPLAQRACSELANYLPTVMQSILVQKKGPLVASAYYLIMQAHENNLLGLIEAYGVQENLLSAVDSKLVPSITNTAIGDLAVINTRYDTARFLPKLQLDLTAHYQHYAQRVYLQHTHFPDQHFILCETTTLAADCARLLTQLYHATITIDALILFAAQTSPVLLTMQTVLRASLPRARDALSASLAVAFVEQSLKQIAALLTQRCDFLTQKIEVVQMDFALQAMACECMHANLRRNEPEFEAIFTLHIAANKVFYVQGVDGKKLTLEGISGRKLVIDGVSGKKLVLPLAELLAYAQQQQLDNARVELRQQLQATANRSLRVSTDSVPTSTLSMPVAAAALPRQISAQSAVSQISGKRKRSSSGSHSFSRFTATESDQSLTRSGEILGELKLSG